LLEVNNFSDGFRFLENEFKYFFKSIHLFHQSMTRDVNNRLLLSFVQHVDVPLF